MTDWKEQRPLYRELTLKEAVERICRGERLTWLTVTDKDGTYEVAVDCSDHRDRRTAQLEG